MRIAALLSAAAAASLLAACGAPNYPTFGEADYRIEGVTTANGQATQTVIYRDGPKMRVEAALPGAAGSGAVVFDESTNAAYVLNPTGQAPVTPAPAQPAATDPTAQPAQPSATAPVTTGQPAAAPTPVLGFAVRVDDVNAPKPMEAAWAALGGDNARHVGSCTVAGMDGHEWRPRTGDTGVRTACITNDGIVLRITQDGAPLWEASALERGPQDPALFGVPAGYQVIDPQAVAAQVGESLEELDSVTGAPPTPQQAPAPRG